jgi:hypothetical protein
MKNELQTYNANNYDCCPIIMNLNSEGEETYFMTPSYITYNNMLQDVTDSTFSRDERAPSIVYKDKNLNPSAPVKFNISSEYFNDVEFEYATDELFFNPLNVSICTHINNYHILQTAYNYKLVQEPTNKGFVFPPKYDDYVKISCFGCDVDNTFRHRKLFQTESSFKHNYLYNYRLHLSDYTNDPYEPGRWGLEKNIAIVPNEFKKEQIAYSFSGNIDKIEKISGQKYEDLMRNLADSLYANESYTGSKSYYNRLWAMYLISSTDKITKDTKITFIINSNLSGATAVSSNGLYVCDSMQQKDIPYFNKWAVKPYYNMLDIQTEFTWSNHAENVWQMQGGTCTLPYIKESSDKNFHKVTNVMNDFEIGEELLGIDFYGYGGASDFLKPFKTHDGKVIYKLINGNDSLTTITFGKPIDENLAKSPVIDFIFQWDGLGQFFIPVNELGNIFMYKEGNKWILDFDNHTVNYKFCNLLFNVGHYEADDTLEETGELTFNYVPVDEEYALVEIDKIKVYSHEKTFTINNILGDYRWAAWNFKYGGSAFFGIYNKSNVSLIDKNESKTGYMVTDPILYSIVL